MNWLDRSLLTAPKEVSSLLELEMKSKWQFKHIRLFMRVQLHTEWEKLWCLSKRKMKCKRTSLSLDRHAMNLRMRLQDKIKKSLMFLRKNRMIKKEKRKLTMIKSITWRHLTKTTRENSRSFWQLAKKNEYYYNSNFNSFHI